MASVILLEAQIINSCMGNDKSVDILLKIHQHLRSLLRITIFLIRLEMEF